MDEYTEYKIYYVSCILNALNGKINSIGTDEDSGDSLEDLQAQIQVLTNLLEML